MREIKFQVLLDNKVVGYERLNESGWQWMWLELNPKNFERWVNGVLPTDAKAESRLSKVVRRMFTGLHDKNGKEIYESDIVKVSYGVGKVIFGNAMFMIEWIGDDSDCMMESLAFSTYDYKYGRPRKDLEIIGNIYENPELLK